MQVHSRWQEGLLRGYKGPWRVMLFIMAKHSVLGDLTLIYKIDNELSLDTMSLTKVRLSYYTYYTGSSINFAHFIAINFGRDDLKKALKNNFKRQQCI